MNLRKSALKKLIAAGAGLFLPCLTWADPVTWNTVNDLANGILDGTSILNSNAPGGITFTNVNGDGYDIVVYTTSLNQVGVGTFFGDRTWWFEGRAPSTEGGSIPYSTVEFRFFATGTSTPFSLGGVNFRLEDAETHERLRNLSYYTASGVSTPVAYNSPILSYASNSPNTYSAGAFDSGNSYSGGTQTNKWINLNFTGLGGISGFTFQVGREDTDYGSMEMTGLGDLAPVQTFTLAANDSYAGITATSSATAGKGTQATLLDGEASTATSATLEFNASGTPGFQVDGLHSDVVALHGTDGDKFVLQLTYDEGSLSETDQLALFLGWYSGGTFVNAVLGNHGASEVTGTVPVLGAYNPATDFLLGNYGVDTVNNTVWAVIDHNSEFAAMSPTPEPTTALLGALGTLVLLGQRRRARRE